PDPAQAPTAPARHGTVPTRAYTEAAPYQGPAAVPPAPAPRTRPGPPRVVAVPVLLVALICFAVGIWALTQT
ncbi:MAG TPA: serine/threonine protein kinase, partial [Streptomyces sp.]|nr:serine/threonine protein kinase [Streptomyces sp.]